MDLKATHLIICENEELRKQHDEDQRLIASQVTEIASLKEQQTTTEDEAKKSDEQAVLFMMENQGLKAKLEASEEKLRISDNYVLQTLIDNGTIRARDEELDGKVTRLRMENEILRASQRTQDDEILERRLVKISTRFIAWAMLRQRIHLDSTIPWPTNAEEVERLAEGAEHVLNDIGAPKFR